jgi:2-polyprenyl-3-methyl-5-hydroxy-6-metoxy-1,4-benzoquinol methylase
MMSLLKQLLRPITELEAVRPLRMLYIRRCVLPRTHKRYSNMDAADVFSEIYAQKQWGDEQDDNFNSGTGSSAAYTSRYCELIDCFIQNHKVQTVVDLGCGDFRVASRIARPAISYVGVDVVQDLIAHNEKTFGADHIGFQCVDVTTGVLPDGDLCLIRQVLQHLSNKEILMVLEKCAKYPYVIVTEHLPNDRKAKPNLDKPHGPDIRLYSNSGVFLEQPPFFQRTVTLMDVPADKWSVLRTTLIEHSK